MVYVYIACALGVVALFGLTLFALKLFKVVKAFGAEVTRVTQELAEATAGLEQAAGGGPRPKPKLQQRPNPEA